MEIAEHEQGHAADDDLTIVGRDDHEESSVPESVRAASEPGANIEPGSVEIDATDWMMESDAPTAEEVEPTELKINVGTPDAKKIVTWKVVPLPDDEFRKFRKAAQPRAARRGNPLNAMMDTDDSKYHLLIVTAATVYPNLAEIAQKKGVPDRAQIVKHRFAHKPGLISQISGVVSDISGYDETDLEVVAKNS